MFIDKIKKIFKSDTKMQVETPTIEPVAPVEGIDQIPGATNYLDNAPEIVGYETIQDQNYVYGLVSRLLNSNSIIDFGCGRGDFYMYQLKSSGMLVDYLGIESNPNLVESGKRLYGSEFNIKNINWFDPQFTDVKDWCVAITTLNTRYDSSTLSDEEYLLKTIDVMMQHCTVGSILVLSSMYMPEEVKQSAPFTQNNPGELLNTLIKKYGKEYGNVFIDHTFSNSTFLVYILK